MDRLKLVLPTAADEQAIWDYREEFFNNNDQHLDGTGGLANVQDFAGWYRKNLAYRSEETTPPDKVPAFTLPGGPAGDRGADRHDRHPPPLKRRAAQVRRPHRLQRAPFPAGGRATPSRCFD